MLALQSTIITTVRRPAGINPLRRSNGRANAAASSKMINMRISNVKPCVMRCARRDCAMASRRKRSVPNMTGRGRLRCRRCSAIGTITAAAPALQKMQRNRHDHGGRRHEKTAS